MDWNRLCLWPLIKASCSRIMIPLEHLDWYMLIFAVGCSVYLLFMLLLLAFFLRKFTPLQTEMLPVYSQAVELTQMKTYTLPHPDSANSASYQGPKLHRSHGARSNRSHSSSGTHTHRKRKKILVMRRPDISQMERLATL